MTNLTLQLKPVKAAIDKQPKSEETKASADIGKNAEISKAEVSLKTLSKNANKTFEVWNKPTGRKGEVIKKIRELAPVVAGITISLALMAASLIGGAGLGEAAVIMAGVAFLPAQLGATITDISSLLTQRDEERRQQEIAEQDKKAAKKLSAHAENPQLQLIPDDKVNKDNEINNEEYVNTDDATSVANPYAGANADQTERRGSHHSSKKPKT